MIVIVRDVVVVLVGVVGALVCAHARVNRRVTRDPNFPFGYTVGAPRVDDKDPDA